jgi:hypothetical protein
VVDDQHAENAENGNGNRNLQGRAAGSAQTIFRHLLCHQNVRLYLLRSEFKCQRRR